MSVLCPKVKQMDLEEGKCLLGSVNKSEAGMETEVVWPVSFVSFMLQAFHGMHVRISWKTVTQLSFPRERFCMHMRPLPELLIVVK